MSTVRSRTLLAVAALVIAAGGVAAAVATAGSSTPVGRSLIVQDAVIKAYDLFPTSSQNPDPHQVAKGVLDLEAFADDDGDERSKPTVPVRLVAECTNCLPGSHQEQQFQDLIIEVTGHGGGKVYEGPLAALDAQLVNAKKTTLKVWLADSGKPQQQGVLTEFSLTATESAP